MMYLIAYDVNTETGSGKTRLRKIAKECENFGQRVQKSVFECSLDADQYRMLKEKLVSIMDEKTDNLRFYNLGNNYRSKVEKFGSKITYQPDDLLII